MGTEKYIPLNKVYSRIYSENIENNSPEENREEFTNPSEMDINTELGGNAQTPLSNKPQSEITAALKEILRYKRPSYGIQDDVIDSISEEELEAIQKELDKMVNYAKVSKVATESVNTSSYLKWM